jgi:hypothetical protein
MRVAPRSSASWPGEMLRVDTGCLVAMTQTVDYDIQFVGGIKNTLFGGEGLFFASSCAAPVTCGSKACPSAVWRTTSSALHPRPVEAAKAKARSSAAWVDCWTGTDPSP